MGRFQLMNEPLDYQLSVRINGMINYYSMYYSQEEILNMIKNESDDHLFDSVDRNNNDLFKFWVNCVQIRRYFGKRRINKYIKDVYQIKAA